MTAGPGTIICDLDGVVYLGDEPVPGAGASLDRLDREGYRVVFCTNNSSRRRRDLAAKIAQVSGYPAKPSQVLSSATAAARLVAGSSAHALVVGGEGIDEALAEAGVEVTDDWRKADTVMVGLDRRLSYERLASATLALRDGARFVATNRDATFPSPRGLLPGAGSMVAALEAASGRSAETAGKPHEPMRELLRAAAGEGPVWVVGDRPDTDLAMAHAEGWQAVLVLTGVTTAPDSVDPSPGLVLDSIAELPAALAQSRR